MKTSIPVCLIIWTISALGQGSVPNPLTLDILTKGLSDPFLVDVPELTEQVKHRGVDFDLGTQLGAVLAAASVGKRSPDEVAALILACLETCESCRMRVLAPMSADELRTRLEKHESQDVLLQEVRVRGVKDLEISDAAAHALRARGASDELVNLIIPDDKILAIPVEGYTAVVLKHAEEYDPLATKGWLKISTEAAPDSQNTFIFKHNGLFVHALKGLEPTDITAYFTKPAPRRTEPEQLEFRLEIDGPTPAVEEKRSGFAGLHKVKPKLLPTIKASYLGAGDDGRNGFSIVVTNQESEPQPVSFILRWQVPASSKASTVSKQQ